MDHGRIKYQTRFASSSPSSFAPEDKLAHYEYALRAARASRYKVHKRVFARSDAPRRSARLWPREGDAGESREGERERERERRCTIERRPRRMPMLSSRGDQFFPRFSICGHIGRAHRRKFLSVVLGFRNRERLSEFEYESGVANASSECRLEDLASFFPTADSSSLHLPALPAFVRSPRMFARENSTRGSNRRSCFAKLAKRYSKTTTTTTILKGEGERERSDSRREKTRETQARQLFRLVSAGTMQNSASNSKAARQSATSLFARESSRFLRGG